MMIKCRECKTVYDDKEKYCPYCFTRTKAVVRYRTNMDNNRLEGSVMKKRSSTNFDYQKRATTKFKTKRTNPLVTIIPIIFSMIFFYMFISLFFNMLFFF